MCYAVNFVMSITIQTNKCKNICISGCTWRNRSARSVRIGLSGTVRLVSGILQDSMHLNQLVLDPL